MFSRSVLFSAEGGKKALLTLLPSKPAYLSPLPPFPPLLGFNCFHHRFPWLARVFEPFDRCHVPRQICIGLHRHGCEILLQHWCSRALSRRINNAIARDLEKLDSIIDCSFKGCVIDDFVLGVVKTHSCASWSRIYYV